MQALCITVPLRSKTRSTEGNGHYSVGEMFRLQPKRHNEEDHRGQFQLRQNRGIGNKDGCDAAGGSEQSTIRWHEKKMTEFSAYCARQIKIEKLPLPKNRLQVAAQQIEHGHIAEQMPWSAVQKHG